MIYRLIAIVLRKNFFGALQEKITNQGSSLRLAKHIQNGRGYTRKVATQNGRGYTRKVVFQEVRVIKSTHVKMQQKLSITY